MDSLSQKRINFQYRLYICDCCPAVECNVVVTVTLCFCRQFGALGPGLYEYGWMGEIAGYYL